VVTNLHKLVPREFGDDFLWGVAMAAVQNEGAWNLDGKGPSIWDSFSRRQGKIKGGGRPVIACDFYHRYKDDLLLARALGFSVFRFSISWPRLLPDGTGRVNKEGIAFYHRVIDECLKLGLTPYITLYHWDLPLALEKEGGWTNFLIGKWFARYVTLCAEEYGDKVKDWIVLNEPFAFTSLGYMLGRHAPGRRGLSNFLPAIHHVALAQAAGGRILRATVSKAHIGTTFSCSEVLPRTNSPEDIQAARRLDILMNRLFIEPALGRGYPREDFKFLEKLELHNRSWKYTEQMTFNFDFIGIQSYFPIVVRYNPLIPVVQASEVRASTRKVPQTSLGWEINPDSFYRIVKRFWLYGGVKEIIITESGAAFRDELAGGAIHDQARIDYYQAYLLALLRAIKEGVNVKGFFAWTLTDNFEWAFGYNARFGLIHVDFATQLRTIKSSGYWFRDLLA
jgi:beta-glucosidase